MTKPSCCRSAWWRSIGYVFTYRLSMLGCPKRLKMPGQTGWVSPGRDFARCWLAGCHVSICVSANALLCRPLKPFTRRCREAVDTIAKMPATFMTYPNGGPVFPTTRRGVRRIVADVVLDAEFLARFGTLEVPRKLWRALGRFAVWVEPALIAEWLRLMRCADRQGRKLDEGVLGAAMTWSEPKRETALPRERAIALMQAGGVVHCVWSGRRLEIGTLEVDHCLPWTAWPCGDLWNLMPAHFRVNRHEKRDRLPADDLLKRAAAPIQEWWQRAYLAGEVSFLPRRSADEARASLPGLGGPASAAPEEVFAALRVQRLRLRHDQQVPEWSG